MARQSASTRFFCLAAYGRASSSAIPPSHLPSQFATASLVSKHPHSEHTNAMDLLRFITLLLSSTVASVLSDRRSPQTFATTVPRFALSTSFYCIGSLAYFSLHHAAIIAYLFLFARHMHTSQRLSVQRPAHAHSQTPQIPRNHIFVTPHSLS